MATLVGQQIAGRYQVMNQLGEGGMGGVYRALDRVLQIEVALKVLHARLAEQGDFRQRFLQEARAAARLNHPGIVRVYDFGRTDALLYIVMELIPGGNLHTVMHRLRAKQHWLDPGEGVQLIRQIALALDYAHRQGVLHRDLKPANIMLRPSDKGDHQPVITDLGLAKLEAVGMTTRAGITMGTPAYMSPEQAIGEKVDARSDVYSLGVLLYELVVGQLPFSIKSIQDAQRHQLKEPPPPRALRPELPKNLENLILKAIAPEPSARFRDAQELADALERVRLLPFSIRGLPRGTVAISSIASQYQSSLSPVKEAAPPPPRPTIGPTQLQIRLPNGNTRQETLRKPRLTIGRHEDNDLILLDDKLISRAHARLDVNGEKITVTDLGSINGTYLEERKLPANTATRWEPDRVLRIGRHRLQYQLPIPALTDMRSDKADTVRAASRPPAPPEDDASIYLQMPEQMTLTGKTSLWRRILGWILLLLLMTLIGGVVLALLNNPQIIPNLLSVQSNATALPPPPPSPTAILLTATVTPVAQAVAVSAETPIATPTPTATPASADIPRPTATATPFPTPTFTPAHPTAMTCTPTEQTQPTIKGSQCRPPDM